MKVAIVMGSKSDYDVVSEAVKVIQDFSVEVFVSVISAHRTPVELHEFSQAANDNYDVIIAAAGGSAHLPGMIAANCAIPVIGLPIKSRTLNGVDSLLSIVQMPKGVPVATVAINGGENAGLLALQILSVADKKIQKQLIAYKQQMHDEVVVDHNEAICKLG